MRKNLNKIFFGIAVLAAGIIFLGSAFGFWEIGEMSGWWTVFIIVPAIGSMIASGIDLLNVAAVAVGVWLLLKCNPQWVPAERMNHFAIAIALVTVGFWLIFSTVKTKKLKKRLDDNSGPISQESKPTYTAVCSGGVYKNTTGNLLGAHCLAILGGLEVDLSEAQINDEITISVTAILGGVDIYLPENVRVECSDGASLLGGIDNKMPANGDLSQPLVHIKHFTDRQTQHRKVRFCHSGSDPAAALRVEHRVNVRMLGTDCCHQFLCIVFLISEGDIFCIFCKIRILPIVLCVDLKKDLHCFFSCIFSGH